jgi:hypothetical protein
MKQTINKYQFAEAFKTAGRGDQFSYRGLDALFDWLEEVEGEEWELDVIALCCDFSEYESAIEAVKETVPDWEYECSFSQENSDEENEESALEHLRENTSVIEFTGGIIIQAF